MSTPAFVPITHRAAQEGPSQLTVRQAYPSVYSEPQPQNWYYSRYRPSFFATPLPLSPPAFAPADTPVTDPILEHLSASLKTLQSQFTAFQESLGNIDADVKDALSQLRALRTAQNKTEKCIADMEGVIGVAHTARARGGRSRGRGGKVAPHAEGAHPGTTPENTLVQSVASIQSAIQLLLAHVNQPSKPQTPTLLPANPVAQASSHSSSHLIDSSRRSSNLQSTRFLSRSGLSSLSMTTDISPMHPPATRVYAHASTQACPFSPSSEPSYPHSDVPGLTPVNWTIVPATHRHPVGSLVQQTTSPAEQPGSSQLPDATNSLTDSQASQHDSDHFLRTQQVHSIVPGTSDPSKALVIPPAGGSTLETQMLSSQSSLLPSLTSEDVKFLPGVGPFDDSPLSTLTGTRDTLAGARDPHHEELYPDVAETTSQGDNDAELAMDTRASGFISVASGFRRHSTPIEADVDVEPPSCLPTPPSEASTGDHVPAVLTREYRALTEPKINSGTRVRSPLPIRTPSATSLEPSIEENAVSHETRQGSTRRECLGTFSASLSPLSSPPLSPCSGVGGSSAGNGENGTGHGVSASGVTLGVNTPETANLAVPIVTATDVDEPPRSTAEFSDNSSLAPRLVGHDDQFMTPESSVGQLDLELPSCDPDNGVTVTFSQMDGYDFSFSSPWRRPSPPTPATPSDSSISRRAQEEEVWGALMLGASDISTPTPESPPLPLMFSDSACASSGSSRSSSQLAVSASTSAQDLFSVDPLMLHDPPSTPRGYGLPNSPLDRGGSLSSLTSLDDADEEETERSHFETHCTPSLSRAPITPNTSVAGPASEVTGNCHAGSRPLGGPSASLDQLALLARRKPLKIHLKVPERMRGLKRKRDTVRGGDTSDLDNEPVHPVAHLPADDAAWEDQTKVAHTKISVDEPSVSGTPRQNRPPSQSPISHGAFDAKECSDDSSYSPVRKRTKKRSERNGKSTHASSRHKKSKRAPKVKQRSPTTYHVWNGQIVAVERELQTSSSLAVEPPQAPVIAAAQQPPMRAEADVDELEPSALSDQTGREIRAPPSPPTRRRSSCASKSSTTKEDAWDSLYRNGGTWPKLPIEFSQWDIQFIQCDNCDKWYHYGCVAIQPEDPRLEPGSLYICPPCHNQSAKRQTLRNQDEVCARPGCPAPQVTSDTETFYLEKLVGRKKVEGYLYLWLAKWDGYPMSQATWIPRDNVVGDRTRMFNAFLEEALEEGADLSEDLILLREAVDAGWEQ